MPTIGFLKRKLAFAAAETEDTGERKKVTRLRFMQDAYSRGGRGFVERAAKYGKTERGDDLIVRDWFSEYMEILADLRLHHVLTTGPAQCGKTLANTMFMVDTMASGKLNVAWFYNSRTNLQQNAPMQFHPIAAYWIEAMVADGHKFNRAYDSRILTRYQIDRVNGIFSYVSTNRAGLVRSSGKAAAGGAAVSFQADMLFMEERSQYPPGTADPLPRRLDASVLPTRPIRELGTPGGGQGIESELKMCDRYFYPHYTCPHCGETRILEPMGCLLLPITRRDALGRSETAYLSESGRPVKWFHHDENDAMETAYVGCSACGEELPDKTRFAAHFRCKLTGQSARDFLDSFPVGVPKKRWKVAIHLSPLCREVEYNLATEIIKGGLDAVSTKDWQQQALGYPSEVTGANITPDLLRAAMRSGAPPDGRAPNLVLTGIDVGRAQDWMMVVQLYYPDNYHRMSFVEILEQTKRVVVFGGDVIRPDIPELMEQHQVQYGLIDNEPSRESSMQLCRTTCLEMVDQANYFRSATEKITVSDGGLRYNCWGIRSDKFMSAVIEGFLLLAADEHPLYRLPPAWEKWFSSPSERSPVLHLTSPYRNPETGKWQRGAANDLFVALSFVEAAFYIKLMEWDAARRSMPMPGSSSYGNY